RLLLVISVMLALAFGSGVGADPADDMCGFKLRDWESRSVLATKTTFVERPLFRVVDMRNHLGGGKERLTSTVLKSDEPKPQAKELRVRRTNDFEVTGNGSAPAWKDTEWESLHKRTTGGLPYETRVKVLYSNMGLYILMDATDKKITATLTEDFQDLWTEDVF